MFPDFTTTPEDLRRAAARTAALLRTVPEPGAPVPGLAWTIGETAAHLVVELQHYAGFAGGELDARTVLDVLPTGPGVTPGELNAAANAHLLAGFPERDPKVLADLLESAAADFGAAAGHRRPDEPVLTTNGLHMTVPVMAATLLGEQVVHGLDIARARRTPWPVDRRDALLIVEGVLAMAPEYVDRKRAAGMHIAYELRFRGGPGYRFAVDDGTAVVTPAGARADCRITADPAAFVLMGYGRVGQWGQVLRGRIVAGGRKPWLASAFGSLLTPV